VNPAADAETLITELALADLETVTAAAARSARRAAGTKEPGERGRAAALEHAAEVLDRGVPVRAELSVSELAALRDTFLLTAKPFLYVVNVGEADLGREQELLDEVRGVLPPGAELVAVSAKLEEEVEDLPDADAEGLLEEYGISARGTRRIVEAARRLLGLITFYSVESRECRAWLVPDGTSAREAAGEIHTDMMRGFVKAEVVPAEALIAAGSMAIARERGVARFEGRDYIVRDGDVLTFRFTV
jgi:ribosome-binding ATPase